MQLPSALALLWLLGCTSATSNQLAGNGAQLRRRALPAEQSLLRDAGIGEDAGSTTSSRYRSPYGFPSPPTRPPGPRLPDPRQAEKDASLQSQSSLGSQTSSTRGGYTYETNRKSQRHRKKKGRRPLGRSQSF